MVSLPEPKLSGRDSAPLREPLIRADSLSAALGTVTPAAVSNVEVAAQEALAADADTACKHQNGQHVAMNFMEGVQLKDEIQEVLKGIETIPASASAALHKSLSKPRLSGKAEATETARHFSRYRRFFKWHLNRGFGQDAEAAARCSLVLVLFGIPLMMDPDDLPGWLGWLNRHGLYAQLTASYMVFCIWSTFGTTMDLAKQGFLGTLLAVINQCIMVSLFPEGMNGSTDDTFVIWAVVVNGVIFIWGMTWFNLDPITTMWAVQTFVFYWMEFLDPAATPTPPVKACTDVWGAVWGTALCILVMLVPYPLFTLPRAQEIAEQLVGTLRGLWTDIEDFYRDSCLFQREKVLHDFRDLQEQVSLLEGFVENAWWESRLSPRLRRCRRMLNRLCKSLHEIYDIAFSLRDLMHHQKAHQAEMYQRVMDRMQPLLREATYKACELLATCTSAAAEGVIRDSLAEEIRSKIVETIASASAITDNLLAARADEDLRAGAQVGMLLSTVHVICLKVCAFTRVTSEYAEDLLADKDGDRPLASLNRVHFVTCFTDVFDLDVLLSRKRLDFALRHTTKLLFALWFGYKGLYHVQRSFDAGAANVVAVMVNRASLGSELSKNLARVQGAVIGTVLGEMVKALANGCAAVDVIGKAILLALSACLSFFIYFHASRYADSYFGFINIFFMTKVLLQPCEKSSTVVTEFFYYKIVDIVAALFIIVLVDSAFNLFDGHAKRPSCRATQALTDTFRAMRASLAKLFDPKVGAPPSPSAKKSQYGRIRSAVSFVQLLDVAEKSNFAEEAGEAYFENARVGKADEDTVRQLLQSARELAVEAAMEPRYWEGQWRERHFSDALEAAGNMRLRLSSLFHAVVSQDDEELTLHKNPFFFSLLEVPSLRKLWELLDWKLSLADKLLKIFRQDVGIREELLGDGELWTDRNDEWSQSLVEFLQGANTLQPVPTVHYYSLEEDPVAQVCCIIMLLDSMHTGLSKFQMTLLEVI